MRREQAGDSRMIPVLLAVRTLLAVASFAAPQDAPKMPDDLDQFMAKVLEQRKINWDELHGYVFNEREVLEIKGMKLAALESFRKEYVWFVRDGYIVRSPLRVNGVKVSKEEQAKAEEDWLRSRKKRRENVNRDEFFSFKFKPGRYLFGGMQEYEGRKLALVEYYPPIADEKPESESRNKSDEEEKYERMFEKTLRVSMLILPEEHQIVRFTFDNVGLEFLPARWLVRIDDLKASMTMDKPLGDVWLPKQVSASGSISTANGTLSVRYSKEFFDYSRTDVKVRFWFEKSESNEPKP
jgi:hypothetical protein